MAQGKRPKRYKNMAYTLIDTEKVVTYDDYMDYCERSNKTPNRDEYKEWSTEEKRKAIDNFMNNIYNLKFIYPIIVSGTMVTRLGRRRIGEFVLYSRMEDGERKNAIYKAIDRVIVNANEFKVYIQRGIIYVRCYHFYGVNMFSLVRLNNSGWGYKRNIRKGWKIKEKWKGKIMYDDIGIKRGFIQPEFWRKNIDDEHTPLWDYFSDCDEDEYDDDVSKDDDSTEEVNQSDQQDD